MRLLWWLGVLLCVLCKADLDARSIAKLQRKRQIKRSIDRINRAKHSANRHTLRSISVRYTPAASMTVPTVVGIGRPSGTTVGVRSAIG